MNSPEFTSRKIYIQYLILAVSLALMLSLFFIQRVNAQEITPAPGTYSYGSTSEFSPYVALSSSSNLAPTGDSQALGYLAITVLLTAAGGLTILTYKIKKSN